MTSVPVEKACRICRRKLNHPKRVGRRMDAHRACVEVVREHILGKRPERTPRPVRAPAPEPYMPPVVHPLACHFCAGVHTTAKEIHECHDRAHRAARDVAMRGGR